MRALFLTDVHGCIDSYEAAFRTLFELKCEALILGGDLLPLPGMSALPQKDFVREYFADRFRSLHAQNANLRIFMILGNYDMAAVEEDVLDLERQGLATYLHNRAAPLSAKLKIAGYQFVPITPFALKDWEKEDVAGQTSSFSSVILSGEGGKRVYGNYEQDIKPRGTIGADLEKLGGVADPASTVYVVHTPPHDTALDVMYDGRHIGSKSLRAFIEKLQPPLTLHGHIHESPRMTGKISDKIGKTFCVNPGDSKTEMQAVCFDPERPEKTLKRITARPE